MSWEGISTIAEVVGAIAVVVSLIYLGLQVNHGNKLSRANSFYGINNQFASVFSQLASDAELVRICCAAADGEVLSKEEFARYTAYLCTYFAFLENAFVQIQSGLFSVELGTDDITEFMVPQYKKYLTSEQSIEWWKTEGKGVFSPEFHKSVSRHMRIDD